MPALEDVVSDEEDDILSAFGPDAQAIEYFFSQAKRIHTMMVSEGSEKQNLDQLKCAGISRLVDDLEVSLDIDTKHLDKRAPNALRRGQDFEQGNFNSKDYMGNISPTDSDGSD